MIQEKNGLEMNIKKYKQKRKRNLQIEWSTQEEGQAQKDWATYQIPKLDLRQKV
jgi:hypothetical protein